MEKTIRTVWSTFLVIRISVRLFGSTLLVLIRVRTVCQGYQQTTKVTASDSLIGAFVIHTGPSPRNQKWSGGRSHRVPKAREEESTRGGLFPSRQGGWGVSPEIFFEFWLLLCAFLMRFLCVLDKISVVLVTIFC